jgi:hypothetical protein
LLLPELLFGNFLLLLLAWSRSFWLDRAFADHRPNGPKSKFLIVCFDCSVVFGSVPSRNNMPVKFAPVRIEANPSLCGESQKDQPITDVAQPLLAYSGVATSAPQPQNKKPPGER